MDGEGTGLKTANPPQSRILLRRHQIKSISTVAKIIITHTVLPPLHFKGSDDAAGLHLGDRGRNTRVVATADRGESEKMSARVGVGQREESEESPVRR